MWDDFIVLVVAGLFCGFVDSSLGMGYGVTSATVLVSFGTAPAVASASLHTAEAFVDSISAASHLVWQRAEDRSINVFFEFRYPIFFCT